MLLNYAGNHLLHFIYNIHAKKIFFPLHEVVQIQLEQNGEITTTAIEKRARIELDPSYRSDGDKAGFHLEILCQKVVSFRSKAIVLSNGGVQSLHPLFFKWFKVMLKRKQDVILSDQLLQKETFLRTMRRLKLEKRRKIVIIGGSHSGFSAAWILLNGPSSLLKNTKITPKCQQEYIQKGDFEFPGADCKKVEACQKCCACSVLRERGIKQAQCKCVCYCFGFFRYSHWGFDYEKDLPSWEPGDIQILYRDKIKVFYKRVADAARDGYKQYSQEAYSRENGLLYAFSGLRGDSKKLYTDIMNGREERVKLVKAATPSEQLKYVEKADLVIWACGYETNQIPIQEADLKPASLATSVPFTQFDVDQRCRLITSDYMHYNKIFGSGLAYPQRTNDGMINSDARQMNLRADSFSFYMNTVGSTMLENLLPKAKLGQFGHKQIRPGLERDHYAMKKSKCLHSSQILANALNRKHRQQKSNVTSVSPVKISKMFNQTLVKKKSRQNLSGMFPEFEPSTEAQVNYCAGSIEKSPRRSIRLSLSQTHSLSKGQANLSQRSNSHTQTNSCRRPLDKRMICSSNIAAQKVVSSPYEGLLSDYGYGNGNSQARLVATNHRQRQKQGVNWQNQGRKATEPDKQMRIAEGNALNRTSYYPVMSASMTGTQQGYTLPQKSQTLQKRYQAQVNQRIALERSIARQMSKQMQLQMKVSRQQVRI